MYMKKTGLMINHTITRWRQCISDFSPEIHLLAGKLRPRCVDHILGVACANRLPRLDHVNGRHKQLPKVSVAQ
jgi:hypothetical protein